MRSVNDDGHQVGILSKGEYRGLANARRGARDSNDSAFDRGHDRQIREREAGRVVNDSRNDHENFEASTSMRSLQKS